MQVEGLFKGLINEHGVRCNVRLRWHEESGHPHYVEVTTEKGKRLRTYITYHHFSNPRFRTYQIGDAEDANVNVQLKHHTPAIVQQDPYKLLKHAPVLTTVRHNLPLHPTHSLIRIVL